MAFGIVGLIFFLAPGPSSINFPWGVSPFVAMTIGAWSLGIASISWEAARIWRWGYVYPMLLLLWVFSVAELLVVALFLPALRTGSALTYPYLIALALGVASAASGAIDWLRVRPGLDTGGQSRPRWATAISVLLAVFVGGLAVGLAQARPGGTATTGGVFPEPLTLFTVRAFAAFFLALAISIGSLLLSRFREPALELGRGGIVLATAILTASVAYLGAFDFAGRPGGLAYVAAYLVFLVIFIWAVARDGRLRLGGPDAVTDVE